MKSILIISALIACVTASAQNIFPENGSWDQKYHSIAWGHGGEIMWDYTIYSQYTLNGDTIAGGNRYLKLFRNHDFAGYIYIDSLQVRVGPAIDSLWVLFDFGLKPGDTFIFHAPSYSYGMLEGTVSLVDSVLVKGEYRKRIKFDAFSGYGSGPEWIEGVGDVNFGGIELDFSYVAWWANTNTLICFSQDRVNIYGKCDLGVPEENPGAKLWPNPTCGPLSIELDFRGRAIPVYVYDATGRLVYSEKFENKLAYIDLSGMKKGIYLIAIKENENYTYRKIIKY